MKGYRFYLEYPDKKSKKNATVKNPGNHSGNVIAVIPENYYFSDRDGDVIYDAIVGVFSDTNSSVASSGVSRDYLFEFCKRIPENMAREIHPNLFKNLDA